jgi:hypothetical protein
MQIAAKAVLPYLQAGLAAKWPAAVDAAQVVCGATKLTGLLPEWARAIREPIEISCQTAIWVK